MDINKILLDEKLRLENLVAIARERFYRVSKVATVQREEEYHGTKVYYRRIELDRFSPEQKQQFEYASKIYDEYRARLAVFESYVRAMVPEEIIQTYNSPVYPPLDSYKDTMIPCNNIDLDDNHEFTNASIKVGSINVDSPREMTFDEYQQLYTQSLTKLLISVLGANYTNEQATQLISEACTEIYLPNRIKKKVR